MLVLLFDRKRRQAKPVDVGTMKKRIRRGSAKAMDEPHELVGRIADPHYAQQPGAEAEDLRDDLYLLVLRAVREGALKRPGRLVRFVQTLARYQVSGSEMPLPKGLVIVPRREK